MNCWLGAWIAKAEDPESELAIMGILDWLFGKKDREKESDKDTRRFFAQPQGTAATGMKTDAIEMLRGYICRDIAAGFKPIECIIQSAAEVMAAHYEYDESLVTEKARIILQSVRMGISSTLQPHMEMKCGH